MSAKDSGYSLMSIEEGMTASKSRPLYTTSTLRPRRKSFLLLFLTAACFVGGLLCLHADQVTNVARIASRYHIQSPINYDTGLRSNLSNAHALHLLIPASKPSANLCRTILSLNILRYPPPTLLNLRKGHDEDMKEDPTEKITAVHSWLQQKHIKDDDLVLLIDGYDTWFQLPPDIVIARFKALSEQINENLRSRYGTVTEDLGGRVGRFTQKILFGADKICWPMGDEQHDLACSAIPGSSLPEDSWGELTDKDSEGYRNRPRYLNAGTMIGRVRHVKELYDYAMVKIDEEDGLSGDQSILSGIFGEQEYQRELSRQEHPTPWLDWLSNKVGSSKPPNITNLHMKTVAGRNYEFGIGLDYSSRIFFTMNRAHQDAEWIWFNDTRSLETAQARHGIPHPRSLVMSLDLQRAHSPFSLESTSLHQETSSESTSTVQETNLPDPLDHDWTNVPLVVNVHSRKISPILHFGDAEPSLDVSWRRMWFHPWSKLLMQKSIETPPTMLAKERSLLPKTGGHEPESFWNMATATGGAWTDDGRWVTWENLCHAYEDDIFDTTEHAPFDAWANGEKQ